MKSFTRNGLIKLLFVSVTFTLFIVNWPAFSNKSGIEKDPILKYVLVWTSSTIEPISYLYQGQDIFIKRKCPVNNCFVTWDRELLKDLTYYDVVLFHGPELRFYKDKHLPNKRSSNQSYVFASMESSQYYPISRSIFNNFFNFTWTYRLDSDLYFGYIVIKNKENKVIGPKENINWMKTEEMLPVDEILKNKLEEKSLVGAWFVSNCDTPSKREKKFEEIQTELNKLNKHVDVYGRCGTKSCPRSSRSECVDKIQRYYYFYFAMENSFSRDYVTEKLLTAVTNYAIPVVYGHADYKRFMPDGIYLDGRKLSAKEIAKQMIEIINNTDVYLNYFNWHNHYSFHSPEETYETDPYCKFCEYINNINENESKTIKYFSDWWNV